MGTNALNLAEDALSRRDVLAAEKHLAEYSEWVNSGGEEAEHGTIRAIAICDAIPFLRNLLNQR
jgi:hypothetical protein